MDGMITIGTAKKGSGLKVLGQTKKPVYLKFGGCETRLKCNPVVLENLAMDCNLSGKVFERPPY